MQERKLLGDRLVLEEVQAQDAHLVLGAVLTACFLVHMLRVFGIEPQ
jgi:hypothetical protein